MSRRRNEGHPVWLTSFVASRNETGEFSISLHTTFDKSDAMTYAELFQQIDTQMTKAELPALRYWDADEYMSAFFRLIVRLLGVPHTATLPATKSTSSRRAAASTVIFPDLDAVLPVRRMFIFLCAGTRLIHDLQNVDESMRFHAGYDLRQKFCPSIEAQFTMACKLIADADWLAIGESMLVEIANRVRIVAMVGYEERVGLVEMYPAFWKNNKNHSPLFQKEMQWIEKRMDACKDMAERDALEILQRYLLLLAGHDLRQDLAPTLAHPNRIEEAQAAIWESLAIIENLSVLEDYTRMHDWLRWIGPYVESHRSRYVHKFCDLWILLAKNRPVEEECLGILRAFRPDVPFQYSEYLIEANRDKEWVAFHLAENHLPLEEISKPELKIVEKRSMDILLPLYFQGAEWYIGMKNRRAYKYAVRLLKKLATYYKKTKQPERWEDYLGQFMKRHSRLRALHEEMRKKGLIS